MNLIYKIFIYLSIIFLFACSDETISLDSDNEINEMTCTQLGDTLTEKDSLSINTKYIYKFDEYFQNQKFIVKNFKVIEKLQDDSTKIVCVLESEVFQISNEKNTIEKLSVELFKGKSKDNLKISRFDEVPALLDDCNKIGEDLTTTKYIEKPQILYYFEDSKIDNLGEHKYDSKLIDSIIKDYYVVDKDKIFQTEFSILLEEIFDGDQGLFATNEHYTRCILGLSVLNSQNGIEHEGEFYVQHEILVDSDDFYRTYRINSKDL